MMLVVGRAALERGDRRCAREPGRSRNSESNPMDSIVHAWARPAALENRAAAHRSAPGLNRLPDMDRSDWPVPADTAPVRDSTNWAATHRHSRSSKGPTARSTHLEVFCAWRKAAWPGCSVRPELKPLAWYCIRSRRMLPLGSERSVFERAADYRIRAPSKEHESSKRQRPTYRYHWIDCAIGVT